MNLIKIGNKIINLDLMTDVWRDKDCLSVYLSNQDGDGINTIIFTNDEAQLLWEYLIERSDRDVTDEKGDE